MTTRAPRQAGLLVAAGFTDETGFRIGQLAWPLVALQVSDGAWAVGLVAGAFGVPVVLAPWWTRTLRQRVTTSTRLAALNLLEAVVLLAVPLLYVGGQLGVAALVGVGLVRGCLTALTVPARSAVLADLGDRAPGLSATRTLAWDEGQTRAAFVAGPALAGALWSVDPAWALASTSLTCLLAAGLTWAAHATGEPAAEDERPTIRASVRGRPAVLASWVMRGTTALGWFGLGLGLPVLADATGWGAGFAAAALAAYGAGGIVVVLALGRRVDVLPPMRTQYVAWTVCGLAIAAVGLVDAAVAVVALALLAGAATQLANTCCNAQVAREISGPARRAALSGQRTMITVVSTVGLMASGSLFGTIGVRASVVGVGATIVAVTWGTCAWAAWRDRRAVEPRPSGPADGLRGRGRTHQHQGQ